MSSLQQRALILQKAKDNPQLQAAINEYCSRDILYWFNNFAYTFDPRRPPYHFPFNLYGFQEELVTIIQTAIYEGDQVLLKKSRDLGATWIVLLVFLWFWLWEEGSDFHVTTRVEDDIDLKGSKSTMFEKLRYARKRLPIWMKPPLRREDIGHM